MKLPVNMSKIAGKTYKGQIDDQGRPHGHGVMEYSTLSEKKYKYEGHFEHGVRSGYGVWYESLYLISEYEPWEWVQMGDYDSAGRLIHPNTKSGPRKKVNLSWEKKFSGWWKNDDAVHSLKGGQYADWQPKMLEDEKFLNYLIDFKAVRMLPQSMVSKLKTSDNPRARYAYGVWLWACHKDSESLRTAFNIFVQAADEGIADALQMLSRMYYLGEAYDEKTGKFTMNRKLSQELNDQAVEKGSIPAKLKHNRHLFFGSTEIEANPEAAIAEAERESSAIFSESIVWTEQLGCFYEIKGEREKAIKAYEKCIINGYYAPIYDLALMHLEDGDEDYYATLMNIGMTLGVPDCRILGIENEYCWESLSDYEKQDVHRQLKNNLPVGIAQGSGACAYVLANAFLNGKFGFEIDLNKGKEYADLALNYRYNVAAMLVIEAAEILNDPEFISDEDLLELRYYTLRHDMEEQLDYVIKHKDTYTAMGYGDEIENVWLPFYSSSIHPQSP